MKQSYESQIQELNNQLKQVQSYTNSNDAVTAQKVAILDNPTAQFIEENIFNGS